MVAPETVGFSAKRLKLLQPLLQSYIDSGKVPGLVFTVARRGQIAFTEARGVLDVHTQQPMPLDGIFRLASQTKPITAAAALILYEEGRLQLRDELAKFLPEFSGVKVCSGVENGQIQLVDPRRPITIEDLLTHQSGLVPISGAYPIPEKLQALYDRAGIEDPNDDLAAWIARIAALPLHAQPGTAWRYGCGLDVLARVIEVAAGMPFAEFLRQRIFEPLGMLDSDFFAPPEKAARLVRAYQPDGKGGWEDLGEEERASYLKPPRIATGSGNLVSTAADYTHFSQMLAKGGQLAGARILSRKTIQFMAANRLRPDQLPFRPFADTSMAGYGFGLGVRTLLDPAQLGIPASPGEFGWSGWFGTGVWIDPVENLSGVLMIQVAPADAFWPHIPPLEIRKIVYQAIDD